MSKQRKKGTRWESLCARYLTKTLERRVERRALHGGADMGDLGPWKARGLEVVAECKDYSAFGPADVARWRAECDVEYANAAADVILLVVNQGRIGPASMGRARVDARLNQVALLAAYAKGVELPPAMDDMLAGAWCSVSLEDAVILMGGDPDLWDGKA